MSTWTKEQLKSLARLPAEGEKGNSTKTEEDLEVSSQSSRPFQKRAIPKVLFSAILLTPAIGLAYSVMAGNLNLNSDKNVTAKEADPEAERLQKQLEVAENRIEELEAKMAVIKQEQSRPPLPADTPEVEKSEQPQEIVEKPQTRKPSAKPPPPKRVASRPVAPQPVVNVRRNTPPPQPKPPPPPVLPSVYGGGAISHNQSNEPTMVKTTKLKKNNSEIPEFKPVSFWNEPLPTIDPDLEAPLLLQQQMLILKTGAEAKATLTSLWVRDLRSSTETAEYVTVVLSEPLMAGTRVFLPTGSTILVKAESQIDSNLIEFTAVEAYTSEASNKVSLPTGVIRFSAADGSPLLASVISDKSRDRNMRDILDDTDQVLQIIDQFGRGSRGNLRDLLGSRRQVSNLVNRSQRNRDSQLLFLRLGTELKLYVEKEVAVPVLLKE